MDIVISSEKEKAEDRSFYFFLEGMQKFTGWCVCSHTELPTAALSSASHLYCLTHQSDRRRYNWPLYFFSYSFFSSRNYVVCPRFPEGLDFDDDMDVMLCDILLTAEYAESHHICYS